MVENDTVHGAKARQPLIEALQNAMPTDGARDVLPGLRLARATNPTDRVYGVFKPSLCVVAQGAKEIYVGDNAYRYDSERYLIATVELPMTGRVVEASPDRPYLSLRLDLDPALVGSVMVECGLPSPHSQSDARAVYVSQLAPGLLDAVVRLVNLLDSEVELKVLMPLIKREIVFRLLMGQQGERLRHLPMMGGHSHRIAKAVEKLRTEFDRPLSMESIARELGMSSSGFHHHFKTVMNLSPLQFQKLIRLQEARQLMLGESLDASSAGYRVGYEDPSHFSRDYKKHFGNAPMRDIEKLRSMAVAD
jgi:AraC-like DNA-binding protein